MLAPLFTVGTLLRQARIFHPRGIYFKAKVEPAMDVDPKFAAIAAGLSKNEALMRLSAGISNMRRGILPDILGMSIRFNTSSNDGFAVQENTQDLLLATSKSLFSLPIAALQTNQRDFLANRYYGMGNFEIADQSNMELRVTPLPENGGSGEDRYESIRDAVANSDVVFLLETSSAADRNRWYPLVRIRLVDEVKIDDRKMAFWPFTGQEIKPRGFIHYMRPMPYLSSQWARQAAG